jgi:hypothetical protein
MTREPHPLHKAYADALDAGGPAVIPVGRTVLCDACDTDLTNDTRSGGFMFGSYAYGPCCAWASTTASCAARAAGRSCRSTGEAFTTPSTLPLSR